jgi:hypothetical protein
VAPGVTGEDERQLATTPWGMEGAGRQGGVRDEALAGLVQRPGDGRRAPRARALAETRRALTGTALAPRAEGGIRQLEWVGNGVQALPLHDLAHGLRTAEDAGFLGLCEEGVSGREGVIGNVQFEGPHRGGSSHTLLQK